MALKLPDSAVPMGDFPVARAVDIDFDDGENLQEKLDNGALGGGSGSAEGAKTYTSLSELGLTEPVSVGEIFNAMTDDTIAIIACEDITNHITDVPMSYGVLTIKKKNNSRFSIEYQNSLGGSAVNVKRWIGTVKGTDGSGLYWKEMQATNGGIITSDTITKYGTEILKYPVGTWRIDSVNIGKQFTDLPYTEMAGVIEIDSIQPDKSPYEHTYGYRNYTFRDALNGTVYTRSLNSGNTVGTMQRDSGWKKIGISNALGLVVNSQYFKISITKKNPAWYCNLKFSYVYGVTPTEVDITITSAINYTITKGYNTIESITYTADGANIAIGIKCTTTMYGTQTVEMPNEFGVINSLTEDVFTGDTTATLTVGTCDARITTLETQVSELFQSVSDGKTLVANAITGKGVSTATDATFATMATNIGKISGGYKEETKSLIVTSNSTGTEALPFKFSANVIAVKQIVAPSDSCRIVIQTSKNALTINGSQIVLYVTGSGTWKVTALIEK